MPFLLEIRIAGAVLALIGVGLSTAPTRAGDAPPGALSCSGCHARGATVETPVPRLAGLKATDLSAAMTGFRDGTRPASVMNRIAKGFTDAEVEAIARWYEAQSPAVTP